MLQQQQQQQKSIDRSGSNLQIWFHLNRLAWPRASSVGSDQIKLVRARPTTRTISVPQNSFRFVSVVVVDSVQFNSHASSSSSSSTGQPAERIAASERASKLRVPLASQFPTKAQVVSWKLFKWMLWFELASNRPNQQKRPLFKFKKKEKKNCELAS